MINTLNEFLEKLPEHLQNREGWLSLNMNLHEPVIERIYKVIGNYRLCLNKIYKSDAKLLFHNHSWPFAVKVFFGEYEMGTGISEDGTKPEITNVQVIGPGMSYNMTGTTWHYTKPISDYTYSVMIIDDCGRWRPQTCVFDDLSEQKQNDIFTFFQKEFTK